MEASLLELVEHFPGRRVLVVGDFMLDRYVFGDAERISPEAPVPVLRVLERQDRVGGAGSVCMNTLALGARVACFGLVGKDSFGDRVRASLQEAGADVAGLLSVDDRPTITKTRLVGLAEHRHRQQVLRVDDEVVRPAAPADEQRLAAALERAIPAADVVCIEDYAKGLLCDAFCRRVISEARRHGKPVLVDPARCAWEKYHGATLLTPNRAEFDAGVGRAVQDGELAGEALALIERHALDALVVTLGRDGALLVKKGGSATRVPTRPRAVYDNTGAGDAVLAMLALAVAAGATLEQAVPLANIAGGLEVQKFGCVPIARDEVVEDLRRGQDRSRGKLRALAELLPELTARRQRGETVVFTNGCFDLLHPGHVDLLERARGLGSLLVVGVNSDRSVRSQGKGDDRPIRNQADRVRMLAALETVDYVILFDDTSVIALVQQVAPDVIVKGGDYSPQQVVGGDFVVSKGGRVEVVPLVDGHGTSDELRRIRDRQGAQ